MKENPEIRAKVTNSIEVVIKSNHQEVDLNEPLFAINWFSTKLQWLYHFYNFLAVKSVVKVGGRAFFKAKITETILDDMGTRRDLILIVRYPNGHQFKSLMESTYFKIVSVFRVMAVSKFTFGFTHKVEAEENSKLEDNLYYAIHHFKMKADIEGVLQEIKDALPQSISIKYAGEMVATLNSQKKDEQMVQIPNLMDGLFIFQSAENGQLKSYLSSEKYRDAFHLFQSSHISLLNRISV